MPAQPAIDWKLSEHVRLLRLAAVGSVDDGKSTLIGRLLVETKGAFEDQLLSLRRRRHVADEDEINLALLTDGLKEEREQGITIDVAWRYFATPKRKFIMADCPGHEQYTRNMVTGASTAQAAIVLVDARHGMQEQTKRHMHILALLGVPHLIVAVNKMDLVDWNEARFAAIAEEVRAFAAKQGVRDLHIVPISALKGDMVAWRGEHLGWYQGPTLLEILETLDVSDALDEKPMRLPVQLVNRPDDPKLQDFRGYMGRLASGVIRPGDEVLCLPANMIARIERIVAFGGDLNEAFAPMSVCVTIDRDIDLARGSMIAAPDAPPVPAKEIVADLCWLGEQPLVPRKKYRLK
ncbi:MAG: sulfate adenylyltransferase, partial [Zetaproteobacteria bacterium]